MKANYQISEAELEVMKVLWDLKEATSAQIVYKLTATTDWKPKTIQTLITRLVSKKAIRAENTGGKAFLYLPNISLEEYRIYANDSLLKKMYNGSLNLMLASFIKDQKLSPEEIDYLKKLLDEEAKQ